MDSIIIILKILVVAHLVVNFQPINWILELLPGGLPKWILILLTSCFKCATFWIALVMSGDLIISATSFLVADWIIKINNMLWEKKKNLRL